MDARLTAHGGADVVDRLALEFVDFHHVGGLRESFARERVCPDDDFLDGLRLFLRGGFFGERGGRQPRCCGKQCRQK